MGFSTSNHPAIGVPPFVEKPPYRRIEGFPLIEERPFSPSLGKWFQVTALMCAARHGKLEAKRPGLSRGCNMRVSIKWGNPQIIHLLIFWDLPFMEPAPPKKSQCLCAVSLFASLTPLCWVGPAVASRELCRSGRGLSW